MKTQDSRKVYTTTGPAAGGVWRVIPPPKDLLASASAPRCVHLSMLGRKGILNDASNVHVMLKPTRNPIYYSTSNTLFHLSPNTKVKLLAVDWGDDNRITIWNQIEKEFPRAGLRAE